MNDRAERLGDLVEALVAIPSESRHEEELLAWIGERLPGALSVERGDAALFARPERGGGGRPGSPGGALSPGGGRGLAPPAPAATRSTAAARPT